MNRAAIVITILCMPRRLVLLAIVTLVMLGSLAATAGYVWYLRGVSYRERCAAALSASLALPSEIGAVVPRSRRQREFHDVVVWLPERRGRALSCDRALVVRTPQPDDPNAYEIQLSGGSCEISTRTWLRRDYRGVIEKGLRPGFAPGGPKRVTFTNMDVSFDRDRFRAELRGAAGHVEFQSPQLGRASIKCDEFNGHRSAKPVLLTARFSPQDSGIRIDRLDLIAPDLPVRVAGLRELAGVRVRSGRFNGRLVYEEHDRGRRLTVSGKCFDLVLPECTAGLTPVPWRGRCPEIELQELRIENRTPVRLRFRGVLSDVALGDILATWGLEGVVGTLKLHVGAADLSPRGIELFVASGTGAGISLESLTAALGWGTMTGRLDVTISDLTIENNRLKSLDAALTVAEATNPPNWIEGRLLHEIIRRTFKVDLPPVLPERIEYTQLGVKLEVRDEVLYVFGTHGEREKTILTVRVFEHDMPLIFEPQRSFDLSGWFDGLRARARTRLEEGLQNLSQEDRP
ncbi:MAG: hypothetical protein ACE5I3_06705 [Phycisphaerae bacterium]